jgi:hypothetical protein
MNRIVKKYYPVERLPADLQSGLPKHGRVHIEMEPAEKDLRSVAGLVASGRNVHGDVDSVLQHVRSLRDDC